MTRAPQVREKLATAERAHATAVEREAAARAALDVAAELAGDEQTDASATAWREAREAFDLAKLTTAGAARRVGKVRAELHASEQADARDALAEALPLTDRAALFDGLAGEILSLAEADAVPPVDLYAPADDPALVSALTAQHVRTLARSRALRAIRAAVTAQHAACDAVGAACVVLGEKAPRNVVRVPEEHVHAAAQFEAYASTGRAAVDDPFWVSWLLSFAEEPRRIMAPILLERIRCTLHRRPAEWLEWAREAYRTGEAEETAARVRRTHETPGERENREHNARANVAALEAQKTLTRHAIGH